MSLSPQPNKPKSDAINAARLRTSAPCGEREQCPNADDWTDLKGKVDDIHGAMFGSANEPGYFERVRNLEKDARSRRYWSRTAISSFVVAVLSAAGAYVWSKLTGKEG